ncbi:hypothetical protein M433DRAFT_151958 [Acidomyces richmondensis BFW]|nr:MAG: hypothetical protein FE78DRAFT_86465 [Acidomyces sp. 'richmondensis']KYG47681.1 hypothetical protein M433DRAFT_151958 [Acidomyces richmondensis BFW]
MARTNGDPSLGQLVRSLRYLPMKHELRTKWAYTNNMYSAVVHALETATKQSFEDLIKVEILDPLGMDNTTCSIAAARSNCGKSKGLELARGYLWNSDVGTSYLSIDKELAFVPVPWDQIPPCQGGGGMISNLLDLGRWMKHLMNPCGQTLALDEKVVKAMRTPRMLKNADPSPPFLGTHTYGLGLELAVYHGRSIAWHGGAGHGYMSLMLMVPPTAGAKEERKGQGWAVMILQNSRSRARGIIAWHLLDHFLKLPKEQHRKMTHAARRAEAAARDKFETASKDRFNDSDPLFVSHPQLPLEKYEGLYRHKAFHVMKVSLLPPPWRTAPIEAKVHTETDPKPLRLYLYSGSPKSYHGVSAVLCHLNRESWQAHQSVYVSSWESDSLRKLEFDVSDVGIVKGIRLQVDRRLEDYLPYFEKIS